SCDIQPRRVGRERGRVEEVLESNGLGPHGKPWDCRACGFETCAAFAQAAAMGRASLKHCVPYQARRVEEAQRDAAVDTLTGLAAYKVLHDRLTYEVERSK